MLVCKSGKEAIVLSVPLSLAILSASGSLAPVADSFHLCGAEWGGDLPRWESLTTITIVQGSWVLSNSQGAKSYCQPFVF